MLINSPDTKEVQVKWGSKKNMELRAKEPVVGMHSDTGGVQFVQVCIEKRGPETCGKCYHRDTCSFSQKEGK